MDIASAKNIIRSSRVILDFIERNLDNDCVHTAAEEIKMVGREMDRALEYLEVEK